MKKRFTEAQIAFALRQADSGTSVGEITRKLGIAEATLTCGRRSMPPWLTAVCRLAHSTRKRYRAVLVCRHG